LTIHFVGLGSSHQDFDSQNVVFLERLSIILEAIDLRKSFTRVFNASVVIGLLQVNDTHVG